MSGERGKIRGQIILYYLIAASVLLLDQVSKYCAGVFLSPGESVPLVRGFLHLTLVYNTGAAFGLLKRHPGLFIAVAAPAAALMAYFLARASRALDTWEKTAVSFILGGTLGNLVDRVVYGHVIDFIDFRVWPVFNVADSFITIGAVLLGAMIVTRGRRAK